MARRLRSGAGHRCTSGSCGRWRRPASLDRALEFLPDDEGDRPRREAGGVGLTSPEIAVLVGLLEDHPDRRHRGLDAARRAVVRARARAAYFPPADRRAVRRRTAPTHPLRREIITTVVVNDMINRVGTTFVHRAAEETGADVAADRARVHRRARGVRAAASCGRDRGARQPGADRRAARAATRRCAGSSTGRPGGSSTSRFPIDDVAAEIERFGRLIAQLTPRVPQLAARRRARQPGRRGRPARSRSACRATLALRIGRAADGVPAARRRRDRPRRASDRPTRWPRCTSRCPSGSASTSC